MKAEQIIKIMESHYPLHCQEDWDHCGLQAGNIHTEVNKIMIGLDADLQTLQEAIDAGCQMLITHHPFLFNTLTLDTTTPVGRFIETAVKNNIVVYSAHTSLDKISMNRWLMEELGCLNIEDADESNITKKGVLPDTMGMYEFLNYVKKAFNIPTLSYAGHVKEVSTVGICGGSGGDLIDEVAPQVDAYVTGDLKYHSGLKATDYNILLVDVGHHVEVIMVHKLKELLEKEIDCEILEATSPGYFKGY